MKNLRNNIDALSKMYKEKDTKNSLFDDSFFDKEEEDDEEFDDDFEDEEFDDDSEEDDNEKDDQEDDNGQLDAKEGNEFALNDKKNLQLDMNSFQALKSEPPKNTPNLSEMNLTQDIQFRLGCELGQVLIPYDGLQNLSIGSVVNFNNTLQNLYLCVNNVRVGEGMLVDIDGKIGIKITRWYGKL